MVNAMISAVHPRARRWSRRLALAVFLAGLYAAPRAAAQSGLDVPDAKIPLDSLGYQPAPPHILLIQGYAVSSLHYVDASHILFTYNARSLIKRMPDDSPVENPQNVNAVLLEVPSGKVVARTQWRLHDHRSYLWPVGEGTFLLRLGRELRLLTPLAGTDPEAALRGKLLMMLPGQASMIEVSPDGRMMLVEADVAVHHADTTPAMLAAGTTSSNAISLPLGQGSPALAAQAAAPPISPEDQTTDVQFLEFNPQQQAGGSITVNRVGHIVSPAPLEIPLVHDGYIHAKELYPGDWALIYTGLRGERSSLVLGDVVSDCIPGLAFLSNREVLVVTCKGNQVNAEMTLVTLDKKELWQHALDSAGPDLSVRTTAASGRFAISRILVDNVTNPATGGFVSDNPNRQRIDVMDIKNGALVASVAASPAERTAQNFSITADGRHLAVLQDKVIALYDLAAPQDFAAEKVKPKDLIFEAAPENTPLPAGNPVTAAAAATPAEQQVAAPAAIETPLNVDARRSVPTLLTPEEQRSLESKKDKTLTLPPPKVPSKNDEPPQ